MGSHINTMSEVSLMIKKQEKKMTEVLVKKTHFTFLEIERLFQLYRDHAEDLDCMDRNTFREFLHDVFNMTDDILMDRIFKYFDTVNDGNITREEWIMGLNIFLKGTVDEQIEYCFSIYDLNADGYISREEMLTMLKTCLVRQGLEEDGDEGVKDLIEMTLKKMDDDKDGKVSFSDFETTVKNEPLMLEAFGPCLPTNKFGDKFISSFLEQV